MQLQYLTERIKKIYERELSSGDAPIDRDVQDILPLINGLPFINTTQSCQGHPDGAYLSVMITEDRVPWFENTVVVDLLPYCETINKVFDLRGKTEVYVRYVFWIKEGNNSIFYDKLLSELEKARPQ